MFYQLGHFCLLAAGTRVPLQCAFEVLDLRLVHVGRHGAEKVDPSFAPLSISHTESALPLHAQRYVGQTLVDMLGGCECD